MVDGALGVTMNRRRVLRLLGAAGAAAVVAGGAHAAPATAGTAGNYRTTTDLNLRAKPSTSATVLLVMPAGAVVEEIGDRTNGFMKCRYGGKTGWAYEAYLESPAAYDDPNIIGTDATNTDVNLRSGPSTSHQVLRVLDPGTEVSITDRALDGFRYVVHQGQAGWVWDAFLGGVDQGGGGDDPAIVGVGMTVTDVNLRSGPSTGHSVLRVLDQNVEISVSGTVENGFRYVVHAGLAGWVWDAYIGQGGGGAGAAKRTTSSAVNLRETPSTSAKVLTVVPEGVVVGGLEEYANGFEKVGYNGKTGWIYAAYLN